MSTTNKDGMLVDSRVILRRFPVIECLVAALFSLAQQVEMNEQWKNDGTNGRGI